MVKLKSLHATPEAVQTAFYEALEAGDVDALMEVWSEDDEIVCIHPGGPRLVGHQAIAASWREILSNGPIAVRAERIPMCCRRRSCPSTACCRA